MRIAIDFDDTWTLDPPFWREFADGAIAAGHSVWCVSCRMNTELNREIVRDVIGPDVPIRLTSLCPKRSSLERQGIKIDVWIDDDPNCVEHGK